MEKKWVAMLMVTLILALQRQVLRALVKRWVAMLVVTLILALCCNGAQGDTDCLRQTCGTRSVSYPFRLKEKEECPSFSSYFDLDCKGGELYLGNNITHNNLHVDMRVLHMDKDSIIVDTSGLNFNSMNSYLNGTCVSTLFFPPFPSPFVISDDNMFGSFGRSLGFVIGVEFLSTSDQLRYVKIGGCGVLPGNERNPDCGEQTCCVSHVGVGTSFRMIIYEVTPSPFISPTNSSSPCDGMYATLFHPKYTNFSRAMYGIKLKWALPSNQDLSSIDLMQTPDFACSSHSNSTPVQEVPGYYCSCQRGFDGDGYSQGLGCTDIGECTNSSLNDCIPGKSTCHDNIEGSYTCKCKSRLHVGDGLRNGSGCTMSPTLKITITIISAVVFVGLCIGGVVIFAIWWRRRTKRKYFLQNGGVQLQDIIRGKRESRLFTAEELKTATTNYAEHMKLGMGGCGTVYKGVLSDGKLVAIKKTNRGDGGNERFLNEMQILMHINHRNIVRLLGCCMETAVPLLVYEYVSHGNVRESLDEGGAGAMGWEQRLKVARQTAEALAYLHAAASPPILHRDVKSANVLLDDNLDVKVADFGVSRLVLDGMDFVWTTVQGTIGYLDPEYFQTLQLTGKSDVYSLGVMLVELISGLKPVDTQNREPDFANLALLFIHRMQEARGEELIDPCLVEPLTLPSDKSWNVVMVRSSIMAVADLAHRCLALSGVDRPSMSLVADELRHLACTLEDTIRDMDADKGSKLSKHTKTGAVVTQDAEFLVQPASNTMSISNLDVTTLPR